MIDSLIDKFIDSYVKTGDLKHLMSFKWALVAAESTQITEIELLDTIMELHCSNQGV